MLRNEDRRASNSGLRGHCRANSGPIVSTRRRARRAIGGLIPRRSPRPALSASSKTRTLRPPRPRSRESGTDRETNRAFEWDVAVAGCVTLWKYFWWWNASELEHKLKLMNSERCITAWRTDPLPHRPACPIPSLHTLPSNETLPASSCSISLVVYVNT